MNLNSLDLNLIRVFDALMQERSVTRAGERVGLSQPAVSSALSRLRYALNDQLFIRRGNEMLATPRAEELAELARSALNSIERMVHSRSTFDPLTLERTFTLLGSDFFSLMLMPHLAVKLAESAPRVAVRLLDSARGDVTRLLQDDAVDMALERPVEVPDWISSILLFPSAFVIIAAADNPDLAGVAEGEPVPLDSFCALPHALRSIDGSMSGMVDDALEATGRHRQVVLALPHFQAVALAVARGRMIAAVPSQFAEMARSDLALKIYRPPFDVPVPDIKLYWHSRHDSEVGHQWMRHQVLAAVNDLGFAEGAVG